MLRKSIVFKTLVWLIASILLLSGVLMFLSYERSKDIYFNQITSFEGLSEVKMGLMAKEISELAKKVENGTAIDQNSEEAKALFVTLQSFAENDILANSYVDIPRSTMKEDKRFTNAIGVGQSLLDAGVTFGMEYEMRPELWDARDQAEKGEPAISEVYTDDYGKWLTMFVPVKDQNGQMIAIHGLDLDVSKIESNLNKVLLQDLLIAIALIVVVTVIVSLVFRKMLTPIQQLSKLTLKVAEGDLSIQIPVKSDDEIGQLSRNFNEMVNQLKNVITQVRSTSTHIASFTEELTASTNQTTEAAQQIAVTIQEAAQGAESQAQSVEESGQATLTLSSGIERVLETTEHVSDHSMNTVKEAEQGNELVKKAMAQMDEINRSVEHSAELIRMLEQRSQEISSIVEVITGISSQTNLLALNAAIEAARAGEQGRGFAVVADEVRKLAEQSQQSALQIVELIKKVQEETDSVVQSMNQGIEVVHEGRDAVNQVGEVFQHIVSSTQAVAAELKNVKGISNEMATSSQQLKASIEMITKVSEDSLRNSQHIVSSSQEQLAAMEEIASSSSSLLHVVEDLNEQIQKFKV
ncbi:methyl-accepting chemotaxis protein [Brevibacillus migulae]|uniref:methyl-accepting chemotaxis protein n=1 Tax=Brevibacillus migulae TaxID=1644114 RepID=UPI00106DEF44|nr:methyl-accepting chemotaxis protein [Brevibacillus migulae]